MAEHKHAAVLRAIADGKAVQCRKRESGEWYEIDFDMFSPITHPQFEWRIKPEPKPDVVRYLATAPNHGVDHPDEIFGERYSTIKAIFDGDTGKLKSAEVLP